MLCNFVTDLKQQVQDPALCKLVECVMLGVGCYAMIVYSTRTSGLLTVGEMTHSKTTKIRLETLVDQLKRYSLMALEFSFCNDKSEMN